MNHRRKWLPLGGIVPLPNEGEGGADGGQNGDAGQQDGDQGKPGEGKPEGKMFTQAEVDELISKRVARATKGIDDLKAKAAEWDRHQQASASDEDKRAAEVEQARKDAAAEATAKANARIVAAELKAAAVAAGFHDPSDALARLRDQLADVEVNDDGEVDGKAVESLVADLAKAAPHLVRSGKGAPPPGAAGIGTGAGGSTRTAPATLGDAVNAHYTQKS